MREITIRDSSQFIEVEEEILRVLDAHGLNVVESLGVLRLVEESVLASEYYL